MPPSGECPLSGVKRTLRLAALMSANDPKRALTRDVHLFQIECPQVPTLAPTKRSDLPNSRSMIQGWTSRLKAPPDDKLLPIPTGGSSCGAPIFFRISSAHSCIFFVAPDATEGIVFLQENPSVSKVAVGAPVPVGRAVRRTLAAGGGYTVGWPREACRMVYNMGRLS
jgi:hypothetical protein